MRKKDRDFGEIFRRDNRGREREARSPARQVKCDSVVKRILLHEFRALARPRIAPLKSLFGIIPRTITYLWTCLPTPLAYLLTLCRRHCRARGIPDNWAERASESFFSLSRKAASERANARQIKRKVTQLFSVYVAHAAPDHTPRYDMGRAFLLVVLARVRERAPSSCI